MKISTWQVRGAIGALSLVVVGFLLGVATDRLLLAHGHGGFGVAPAATNEHVAIVAFRGVLQLDDDQVTAIHEILMRNQVSVDQAWQGIRAQVAEGVENAHTEIRMLLTDAQRARFEEWLDRHVRGDPDADISSLFDH